ncbi:GNAT family N-acetyltransferase [Pendulispora rubella]|uniref:GNAT family N-acetyltransferase n=1 Tax=Pendulispora rubella TaxID=2741070 RepID=A0ABZ2L0E6_9BACT
MRIDGMGELPTVLGMSYPAIEFWYRPTDARAITVAPGFTAIARTERLLATIEHCLAVGSVVVAALERRTLVGYATLVPSTAAVEDRWRDVPDLWELGAIEVAEHARRQHVGTMLMGALERALPLPSLVVFARGIVDHWAYVRGGVTPTCYRGLLLALLGRAGFSLRPTDDPEVGEHPLNFLATRFGERTSPATLRSYLEREKTTPRTEISLF